MIIELNGERFLVPEHSVNLLVAHIYQIMLEQYGKLEAPIRLGMKPVARELLRRIESKQTDPEARQRIRPPKGADPTLHFTQLMLAVVKEGLKDVTANITTGTDEITAFSVSIKGESSLGGQVVTDGHFGFGQDNSGEDVRPGTSKALSIVEGIHL